MKSYLFVTGMMLLVIGCVSVVFYMQFYVNTYVHNTSDQSAGNTSVSIISAIQIFILNMIYSEYAISFTEAENHRTDTEFDDSLIGKLFTFNFVNSYASLFFIAFIKTNIGAGACQGPCMVQLAGQLTVIFATQITVTKLVTFVTLVLGRKYSEYKEMKEYEAMRQQGKKVVDPSEVEKESFLEEYDPSLGTLGDYSQIFVQYGYVTLFVTACPFAPLLAYISNWIEMRSDAWKLLRMNRRAVPVGAEDIGTWMTILQLTSYAAVISNAGLLCFTMQFLDFSQFGLAWTFIGFQYFVFMSMGIFAELVDDIPEEVQMQLDRQDHINDLLNMTEEERVAVKEKAVHWAEVAASRGLAEDAAKLEIYDRDDAMQ
jgi:ABC-type multidrug transport system fused ATPase/permease subunit